jgi:hypothetical protein
MKNSNNEFIVMNLLLLEKQFVYYGTSNTKVFREDA